MSAWLSKLFHKLSDLRLGKACEGVLSILNPYPTLSTTTTQSIITTNLTSYTYTITPNNLTIISRTTTPHIIALKPLNITIDTTYIYK